MYVLRKESNSMDFHASHTVRRHYIRRESMTELFFSFKIRWHLIEIFTTKNQLTEKNETSSRFIVLWKLKLQNRLNELNVCDKRVKLGLIPLTRCYLQMNKTWNSHCWTFFFSPLKVVQFSIQRLSIQVQEVKCVDFILFFFIPSILTRVFWKCFKNIFNRVHFSESGESIEYSRNCGMWKKDFTICSSFICFHIFITWTMF